MTDDIYYSWDYDRLLLTVYQRVGECNGCGDCCRTRIDFTTAGPPGEGRNHSPGVDEKGVWSEGNVQGERYFIKLNSIGPIGGQVCPMLTPETRCGIQATKPRICSGWPMHPDHVAPFKNCSYRFEHISSNRFAPPKAIETND